MAGVNIQASDAPQYQRKLTSPRRYWFRFSLRVLLLACTFVAAGLGLLAKKARDQQAAVLMIEQLRGRIVYDYQPDAEERQRRHMEAWGRMQSGMAPVKYVDEPWTPQWLQDLVGKHWFITVREVDLSRTLVTNEQLIAVGKLSRLRSLHLTGVPNVTDDGLANLSSLRRLESLNLSDNFWSRSVKGLTDRGLEHLRHHKRLKYLNLSQNRFTSTGLQHLGPLEQLAQLNLSATRISPSDLSHLSGFRNLQLLHLYNLECDRALLEQLRHLPQLQELPKLSSTVTDADMRLIARMECLRFLNLDGTQVTDAGLAQLKDLKDLEELRLDGGKMTDAGLRSLGSLTKLKTLVIAARPASRVTDAGVASLLNAGSSLQEVSLQRSSITDLTLQRLQRHTSLKTLWIDGTEITDGGLLSLAALMELRHLYLRDTQVSDSAIRKLQQALPNCRITGPK